MAATLGIIILAVILIQGGFYPTSYLLAAVPVGIIAFVRKGRAADLCDYLLWGLTGLYLTASLANGYASDSLARSAFVCVCALFLSLYRTLSESERHRMLSVVLIGSGIFSVAAILAFCHVLPLTGAVISNRLQFTFQYANAAGSWFAAAALLAWDWENIRVKRFTISMITALFLTRSVGAIGLYVCLQAVRLWIRRKDKIWHSAVILHGAAAGFAFLFYMLSGWAAVMLLILLGVIVWCQEKLMPAMCRLRLYWPFLLLGAAGGAAVVFTQRVASSARTFIERLIQILDGSRVIAANPLFGVGAGNWEDIYPFYQSAQYNSTVVHSSIIQIGVDAGIFAILLAAVFFAVSWKRGKRTLPENLALILLAVHSVFDFTMQFFPIVALLLALLFADEKDQQKGSSPQTAVVGRTAYLPSVILCITLLYGDIQYKQLAYKAQANDWDALETQFQQAGVLFGQNRSAHRLYIRALYEQGKLEETIAETEAVQRLTDEELLTRASAVYETGGGTAACQLLLDRLSSELYNVSLFEQTARLFLEWDVDAACLAAYDEFAISANQSQSTLAVLKGDQVYIDTISNLGGKS